MHRFSAVLNRKSKAHTKKAAVLVTQHGRFEFDSAEKSPRLPGRQISPCRTDERLYRAERLHRQPLAHSSLLAR